MASRNLLKLLLPIGLLLAAGAFVAYQQVAAWSQEQQQRNGLFAELDEELQKSKPDDSTLSHLVARLDKLPAADSDRDVQFALARIDMARSRVDRAHERFTGFGNLPEASEAQRRLWVAILLGKHALGHQDAKVARGFLLDASELAVVVAEASGSVDDWFVAWQVAVRLEDAAGTQRATEQLVNLDRDARQARAASLAQTFTPASPGGIHALLAEFEVPPPELQAMAVLAQAQGGQLPEAVQQAEAMLRHAPGLLAVRFAAALVFHGCVLGSETPEQRQRWTTRRNLELDWLLQQSEPEDARRATWQAMRAG